MTRARRLRVLVAVLAVLGMVGCSAEPLAVPADDRAGAATLPADAARTGASTGTVVVAYPDEPSTFLAPVGQDVATDDLAALWGLPLLRLDPAGQVRRGLVDDWEVVGGTDEGWMVRLHLRPGAWSDGSAVDGTDVAATLRARAQADPARFGVIRDVVPAGDEVEVVFGRAYASWADLLVEAGSMLPSEIVAGGLDGYDQGVPVSGGGYELVEREPGLRLVFEARSDGPLGAPAIERVEVLFTPSFETALGLLEDGEADVALGYLALNGVARAEEVDGVTAASPVGGTTVSLDVRPGGALGGPELADRRRGVAETLDVTELVEGLLGPNGERATTHWPLVERAGAPPVGEVREGQDLVLLFPADSEVLGFAARSLQRDLVSRGMTVDLVSEPAPRFAEVRGSERDLALVARRTPRRPSLAPWLDDVGVARAAGAAAADAPAAEAGLAAVAELARSTPLFRVGVLHAWRGVEGLRPSAWVGAGFWNVGEWSIDPDS